MRGCDLNVWLFKGDFVAGRRVVGFSDLDGELVLVHFEDGGTVDLDTVSIDDIRVESEVAA